jgi:hypothetical protein
MSLSSCLCDDTLCRSKCTRRAKQTYRSVAAASSHVRSSSALARRRNGWCARSHGLRTGGYSRLLCPCTGRPVRAACPGAASVAGSHRSGPVPASTERSHRCCCRGVERRGVHRCWVVAVAVAGTLARKAGLSNRLRAGDVSSVTRPQRTSLRPGMCAAQASLAHGVVAGV